MEALGLEPAGIKELEYFGFETTGILLRCVDTKGSDNSGDCQIDLSHKLAGKLGLILEEWSKFQDPQLEAY